MRNKAISYYDSISARLNELDSVIDSTKKEVLNVGNIVSAKSESALDVQDVMMIFISGFIGGAFSSLEKIESTFHEIHNGSSVKAPKGFLEKILHHAGDEIDKGGNFITRNGDRAEFGFHRLFFGHDPLSVGHGDNPLILMINQHGFMKGSLQLFRHLVADTFSKQGLPIPGHSYLDFAKANGKTGNYLLEMTKELNKGTDINNVEAFNHLFSIRMQDILSQGLTWGLITAYIKFRGITDEIRISQLKFSAYSVSFFVNSVSGMIRTGGLPYINWTTLGLMVKEGIYFFKLNYREIKLLEAKTNLLVESNIALEKRVFETGKNIITFDDASHYFSQIRKEENAFNDITNFFEEE